MDNWITPAIGMFLIGQVGASVWWASGTDTTIQANSAAIEKVVENEKHIAIIQVQQAEIVKDVGEIKTILLQNQDLVRQLLINIKTVSE
tara:strand:+ start:52 stop:318 length:267 start_codon:yes stop_codon:yes gene_type:complete